MDQRFRCQKYSHKLLKEPKNNFNIWNGKTFFKLIQNPEAVKENVGKSEYIKINAFT